MMLVFSCVSLFHAVNTNKVDSVYMKMAKHKFSEVENQFLDASTTYIYGLTDILSSNHFVSFLTKLIIPIYLKYTPELSENTEKDMTIK